MADAEVRIEITAEQRELQKELLKAERELKKFATQRENLEKKVASAKEKREREAFEGKTKAELAEEIKAAEKVYNEKRKISDRYQRAINKLSEEQQKKVLKIAPHAEKMTEGSLKSKLKKINVTPQEYDDFITARRNISKAESQTNDASVKKGYLETKMLQDTDNLEKMAKTKAEIADEKKISDLNAKIQDAEINISQLKNDLTEAAINAKELADQTAAASRGVEDLDEEIEDLEEETEVLSESSDKAARSTDEIGKRTTKSAKKAHAGLGFLGKRLKKLQYSFKMLGMQVKTALLWGAFLMPLMRVFDIFRQNLYAVTKQNQEFVASLANLKGTAWTAAAPAFQALTNFLTILMDKLSVAITYVSTFANYLLGLGRSSKKAGQQMAGAAKAANKAGGSGKQKDKKSFAAWDTVQQLQKPQAAGAASGGAAGAAQDIVPPTFEQDFSKAEAALERFKQILADDGWYGVGQALGQQISDAISSFDAAELAQNISNKVISALQFVSGLISGIDFAVLGEKIRNFILNIDWIGIAKEAVRLLGEALTGALEFLDGLFGTDFFQPLIDSIDWVMDAFDKFFDLLSGEKSLEEFFDSLSTGQAIFLGVIAVVYGGAAAMFLFKKAVAAVTIAMRLLKLVFTLITTPVGGVSLAIAAVVAVIIFLIKHSETFRTVFINVWNAAVDKVVSAKDKVISTLKAIKDFVKGVINGILEMFEKMINHVIDSINSVKFDVPKFLQGKFGLGKTFGFDLTPVKLPRLAQGTVVNPGHEFAAILGDNRREQEIVSPLSTMKQAFMEAMRDSGMTRSGTVVMNIDGATFARVTYPYNQREATRVGIKAGGVI